MSKKPARRSASRAGKSPESGAAQADRSASPASEAAARDAKASEQGASEQGASEQGASEQGASEAKAKEAKALAAEASEAKALEAEAGDAQASEVEAGAASTPVECPPELPPDGRLTLPKQVREDELDHIQRRRAAAGMGTDEDVRVGETMPLVGLALSGGGVRSATFNLGILQSLGAHGVLRLADYMSTVSGGGYIGSCFSSLMSIPPNEPGYTKKNLTYDVYDVRRHATPGNWSVKTSRPEKAATDDDRAAMGTSQAAAAGQAADPPQCNTPQLRDKSWWKREQKFDVNMRLPFLMEDELNHLRRHGDFLMLGGGAIRRQMMRGIGTTLMGMASTLSLYAFALLLCSFAFIAYTNQMAPHVLWCHALQNTVKTEPRIELAATLGQAGEVGILAKVSSDATSAWPGWKGVWKHYSPKPLGGDGQGKEPAPAKDALSLLWYFWWGLIAAAVSGSIACAFVFSLLGRFRLRANESIHETKERRWLQIYFTVLAIAAVIAHGWYFSHYYGDLQLRGLLVGLVFFAGAAAASAAYYLIIGSPVQEMSAWLWRPLWSPKDRSLVGAVNGFTVAICLLFVGVNAVALLVWSSFARGSWVSYCLTSVLSLVVARLTSSMGGAPDKSRRNLPSVLRKLLLVLAVVVFLVASLMGCVVLLLPEFKDAASIGAFLLANLWWLVLVSAALLLIDFNRISIHYFYRDRLTDAYLRTQARVDCDGGQPIVVVRDDSALKLQQLHETNVIAPNAPAAPSTAETAAASAAVSPAPYQLIVCSLNLAGSDDLTRKDRKSDHFVFSKLYCGSSTTGYIRTKDWRGGKTKLATAMTISGAAASSGMGFYTSFAQAFALTLFNLRLGVWMVNPRIYDQDSAGKGPASKRAAEFREEAQRAKVFYPDHTTPTTRWAKGIVNSFLYQWFSRFDERLVFWPAYLGREMLALTDSRSALVNISDGGHTGDNIGLYPLLQRRCKLIIACDGGAEPRYDFASLAHAIRQIKIDENVEIEVNLSTVRPLRDGPATGHYLVAKVQYPKCPANPEARLNHEIVDPGNESEQQRAERHVAWIVLLKLSLPDPPGPGSQPPEPAVSRSYADSSETFPNESTLDQVFSDDQFEAYRALGAYIARHFIDRVGSLADDNKFYTADQIIEWCKQEFESTPIDPVTNDQRPLTIDQ